MKFARMVLVLFAAALLRPLSAAGQDAHPDPEPAPAPARKIVFLCDGSETMAGKMPKLRAELKNTIGGLRLIQSFNLIFMREKGCAALAEQLLIATPENKDKADKFANDFTPAGKTNPLAAIDAAFACHPQLIYLLADRDFPDDDAVLKRIRELNKDHQVRVNTIAFMEKGQKLDDLEKLLKAIAEESGGTFKYVTIDDL